MQKFISSTLTCVLLAAPVVAQEEDESPSLMERGAQMFLEGLLKEMEPALEDLSDLADGMGPALGNFVAEMGPKLREIFDEVEDWSAYQAPEILPNGDIIIRRKPDRPLEDPKTLTEPAPQIDL